ncbi:hypothetical protein BTJ66_10535 [Staphylococcus edaphicus]|uniref:Uncharacterized protein n=1 Tax=Staphylococcus edaphicus TaxID=1955013 RepID=A0A2C6WLU7_9STAP|nr:hypothetical protein BTJ66_10535 [Staphylococcus edaphicus]
MLILTILVLLFILVFGLILDKPMIYMFIALFIHSTLLFIIRYFWQDKTFGDAFTHSFDLLTIIIVIIFVIYKFNKIKSNE